MAYIFSILIVLLIMVGLTLIIVFLAIQGMKIYYLLRDFWLDHRKQPTEREEEK